MYIYYVVHSDRISVHINITMHFSNFYRTWHTVVDAFIYMTVGALDLETGSTKNYAAQRPGPWDRDSNSVWQAIYLPTYRRIYNIISVYRVQCVL